VASKEAEGVLDTKPYITCQQLIDFIGAYRDDELTPAERTEFDRHLGVCPSCVAYLRTYEKTVALAQRAGSDPVPDDVPESLVRAIVAAARQAAG
jgi:anti-sigma factor RsiW